MYDGEIGEVAWYDADNACGKDDGEEEDDKNKDDGEDGGCVGYDVDGEDGENGGADEDDEASEGGEDDESDEEDEWRRGPKSDEEETSGRALKFKQIVNDWKSGARASALEERRWQRRRRWPRSTHKAWNKKMHALHGNTASRSDDKIRTALWNSMQLHAGKSSAKRSWLEEQIELYRPTVMVLLEVSGSHEDMKNLRRWTSKIKYDMRFLVRSDR